MDIPTPAPALSFHSVEMDSRSVRADHRALLRGVQALEVKRGKAAARGNLEVLSAIA